MVYRTMNACFYETIELMPIAWQTLKIKQAITILLQFKATYLAYFKPHIARFFFWSHIFISVNGCPGHRLPVKISNLRDFSPLGFRGFPRLPKCHQSNRLDLVWEHCDFPCGMRRSSIFGSPKSVASANYVNPGHCQNDFATYWSCKDILCPNSSFSIVSLGLHLRPIMSQTTNP